MQNLPFGIFSTLIKKLQLADMANDTALINVTDKGFITLYFHRNLIVNEMGFSHGVTPDRAYKVDIDNQGKSVLIQESKNVNIGTINNFRDYGSNPDISRVTMQSNRKIDLEPGIHMVQVNKVDRTLELPFTKTFSHEQLPEFVDYVSKQKLSSVAKFVVSEGVEPSAPSQPEVKPRQRRIF